MTLKPPFSTTIPIDILDASIKEVLGVDSWSLTHRSCTKIFHLLLYPYPFRIASLHKGTTERLINALEYLGLVPAALADYAPFFHEQTPGSVFVSRRTVVELINPQGWYLLHARGRLTYPNEDNLVDAFLSERGLTTTVMTRDLFTTTAHDDRSVFEMT